MTHFAQSMLEFYSQNGLRFLSGFWLTIELCVLGCIGAMVVGFFVYLISVPKFRLTRWLYLLFIDCIRGMPLLILLFILYYAAPRLGLVMSAYGSGLLGLIIYGSAYFAEIYRAGFESIPAGQVEAARAVGLSRIDIMVRIKLPQMLTLIIPPVTNEAIVLVKESAVLSIITVPELTNVTGRIVNETFTVIQPYIAAGVLYWLFVEAISRLGSIVEYTALATKREGNKCATISRKEAARGE